MKKLSRFLPLIFFTFLLIDLAFFTFIESSQVPGHTFLSLNPIPFWTLIFAILIWVFYQTFFTHNLNSLLIITLFFTIYNLINLTEGFSLPLFIIVILLFIFSSFCFYCLTIFGLFVVSYLQTLYIFIAGLIISEIFLTLTFWPTTRASRAAIPVIIFYLIWQISQLKLTNKLTNRIAYNYLAFSIILSVIIVLTTTWYDI